MTADMEGDPYARRDAARRMTREAMRTALSPGTRSVDEGEDSAEPDPALQQKPQRPTPTLLMTGGAILLAALVTGALLLRPHAPATRPPAAPASDQQAAASTSFDIETTNEAGILAAPQDHLRIFRLAAAPAVLVVAFPSMHEQALALDRIGAFVEKAGMPRDRALTTDGLATAIAGAGEDFDTFYYGHDYRAADLRRFFATIAKQQLPLNPEEQDMKTLLQQQGMLQPDANGALISLPPESTQPIVDQPSRATILRHEISHGAYFTEPAYAAYTQHFWSTTLTDPERAAFRKMLGGEGYDTANEDLMRNEAQAYLVHTNDKRFFNPSTLGIDTARLRAQFIEGMPAGWLKDETK